MTPRELYTKPALPDTWWLHETLLLMAVDLGSDLDSKLLEAQTRLVVKVHGLVDCNDGRRYAALASVWFDDAPFAVVQSSGRSGQDHVECFVTDASLLLKAKAYGITELSDYSDSRGITAVEVDIDIPELCRFHSVNFEPALCTGTTA